ncbi:amino acid ABC transporter permease [Saccharothrix sp. BKS2]|uniref:amino acid ABC transporter permease n=1 Tax=Saccharothrix sp. BKS2 TaxID=3064400 RepID=UPI0039E8ED3C
MAMSKRRRSTLSRRAQYVLLLVVALLLAFIADWGELRRSFFDVDTAREMFPGILTVAFKNTLLYTAFGFAIALALGLVLALMKLSSVAPYRWLATIYIEFFRGVPALLVFIAIDTAVPLAFGIAFDTASKAGVALGLAGGAYIAETIRAGIQAVPKGQIEAARSLGMSPFRTTVTVVIPQAFRIVLPPLTNELILLTKDSSLISVVGLTRAEYELTKFGRETLSQNPTLTPILVAGLCYLIITLPLGHLSRHLERRTGGKKIKTPASTEV